jgi:glycosyltransferase involved in cell wall biosynthesis
MNTDILIVVAALDEADRISCTLAALAVAFPGAPVWVADDGSMDATPKLARDAGATVVRSSRVIGKGQAMTAGVQAALASVDFLDGKARVRVRARIDGDLDDSLSEPLVRAVAEPASAPIVVLCDGDLGDSARELRALVDALRGGDAGLAVASFTTHGGGGFGLALAFARWAIRRRCGLSTRAPISGQRALRASVLRDTLPFAPGFGMEVGMTIDAVRAGHRVVEIELDLAHRASGRTPAGFIHRARQLIDFMRAYLSRGRARASAMTK